MMRVAVTQTLLIGISTGCAPTVSEHPVAPVATGPQAAPIPLAKAAVLAEVYGQLLALLRPCPGLRAAGLQFRQHVVGNAGIGRTAEDTRRIRFAMDRALAREAPRWNTRAPSDACAKAGRLLETTRANENDRVSALAGRW